MLRSFFIAGVLAAFVIQPVQAKEVTEIPSGQQLDLPATTVKDWLVQIQENQTPATEVVQVTGVKVNPTDEGLEIILETPKGEQLQVSPKSEDNSYIADIKNAQLRLLSGKTFRSANPVAGITLVTVTNQDTNSIRVTVTGEEGVPTVKLFDSPQEGLIFSVAPATDETEPQQLPQIPPGVERGSETQQEQPSDEGEEQIELLVTGEQDGYNVPDATTATRTDTPIRDIPQSIQVVPQEVIEDQQVTQISDALRNVSSVTPRVDYGASYTYNIRGFSGSTTLRNGLRVGTGIVAPNFSPSGIERVEVLKGPASVLYGQAEPGGIVNFVTKQPFSEPYYAAEFTAGQFSFYEPSIDISGPLTADKRLLYRLNASYQNFGSFVDFVDGEILSIAPVISYNIGDATTLTLEYEYLHFDQTFNDGLPIDPISFDLPVSRYLGDPDDRIDGTSNNFLLTFEHRFDETISLRSAFVSSFFEGETSAYRLSEFDSETKDISRFYVDNSDYGTNYSWQNDLVAKFNTGSVEHQLLLGLELVNNRSGYDETDSALNFINVLNPIYNVPIPPPETGFSGKFTSNTVGVYLQDQVTLLPNLKLLIGGRYDFASSESEFSEQIVGEPETSSSDDFYNKAFSPRVGLVYQPIELISLYASYSRSFVPNNATTRAGDLIDPTRGTQFEIGAKAEIGALAATLAAYEITKTNILTTDPDNPDFSIPVGEVRSRGIEFDIGGEILPGWNILASAFVNDAVVTEDNNLPEGDTLINAPEQGASLWTTYEIQSGDLQGLGFGVGVFYVGDREAELPNDLVLPSYVRADASIFYKRDNWRVGLNFKNLFNTKYYESSQNSVLIYPGAPLTVLGTVSWQF